MPFYLLSSFFHVLERRRNIFVILMQREKHWSRVKQSVHSAKRNLYYKLPPLHSSVDQTLASVQQQKGSFGLSFSFAQSHFRHLEWLYKTEEHYSVTLRKGGCIRLPRCLSVCVCMCLCVCVPSTCVQHVCASLRGRFSPFCQFLK